MINQGSLWAALFDNSYQGQLCDTPGLRRIFIPRHDRDHEGTRFELSRLRVPVEQFFGRLTKLWHVLRGMYR